MASLSHSYRSDDSDESDSSNESWSRHRSRKRKQDRYQEPDRDSDENAKKDISPSPTKKTKTIDKGDDEQSSDWSADNQEQSDGDISETEEGELVSDADIDVSRDAGDSFTLEKTAVFTKSSSNSPMLEQRTSESEEIRLDVEVDTEEDHHSGISLSPNSNSGYPLSSEPDDINENELLKSPLDRDSSPDHGSQDNDHTGRSREHSDSDGRGKDSQPSPDKEITNLRKTYSLHSSSASSPDTVDSKKSDRTSSHKSLKDESCEASSQQQRESEDDGSDIDHLQIAVPQPGSRQKSSKSHYKEDRHSRGGSKSGDDSHHSSPTDRQRSTPTDTSSKGSKSRSSASSRDHRIDKEDLRKKIIRKREDVYHGYSEEKRSGSRREDSSASSNKSSSRKHDLSTEESYDRHKPSRKSSHHKKTSSRDKDSSSKKPKNVDRSSRPKDPSDRASSKSRMTAKSEKEARIVVEDVSPEAKEHSMSPKEIAVVSDISTDDSTDEERRETYDDISSEGSGHSPPVSSPPKPEKPTYYPGISGCRHVEEFEWLNRIEEGTYGVVYRAKDRRTDEVVALKRLKMEKEKEGFPVTSLREVNTLLKARHQNIVTVREIVVGSNMDKIYIVMDYVEHDLKSLMESMAQPFLVGEIKTLTIQLLRGIQHLHDNWILHRDIKASNLLLSHKGILKIADFGLAREYGSPLRQYTPIVVTLWYRAPELLLGAKEYTTAIDIWSVGCVFAEILLMKPLFPGKSEIDQINKIFKELGTPSDKIWPGPPSYSELPAVKKTAFVEHPYNILRQRFGATLTDSGFNLLNKCLTYDPRKRITADEALRHEFFDESPLPVDPSLFPTWPAKSEMGRKARKHVASPKAPEGGDHFPKDVAEDESKGGGLGFHMPAPTKGYASKGPGFSLKF